MYVTGIMQALPEEEQVSLEAVLGQVCVWEAIRALEATFRQAKFPYSRLVPSIRKYIQ